MADVARRRIDVDAIPDKVIDQMMAECLHDAFYGEATDEEIARFTEDVELTPEDEAVLALMPPSDVMSDFIVHKAAKRDGSRGKADGCLLVWDDEVIEKSSR